MKTINIIASIILILFFISCERGDNEYRSTGVIVGQDLRMCPCCGGWMITIDNSNYDFDNLPVDSGIDLESESFPITVKLDWKLITGGCPDRIIIQRIKKI